MALALVPVLAQALTVQVGDRAEVRRRFEADESFFEVENGANVSVRVASRNSGLGAYYAPSIVVTPLESLPRETVIFHRVGADASLTWKLSRRTTIRASQSATYDQTNTRLQALSAPLAAPGTDGQTPEPTPDPGPDPGTGMPPSGMPEPAPTTPDTDIVASSNTVEIGSARTELTLDHALSSKSSLQSYAAYVLTSGLFESREVYPLIQGPEGGATYSIGVSRRDELSTTLTGRYAFSSVGERAVLVTLSEGWAHRFSRYATMNAGVGVGYAWTDPVDGPPESEFYPGGNAGLGFSWVSKVQGGRLTVSVGATYAPVLDQARFRPDARVGLSGGVTWTKRRLTLYAQTYGTLSAEPDDPGALNSVFGSAGAGYELGAGFVLEGGARAAWQTFEQVAIVRPTAALFVALSWGATVVGR